MLPEKRKTIPPEVAAKLTPQQRGVLQAIGQNQVGAIPEQELAGIVANLVKYIARDIGVKTVDQYDATRFCDIVKRYYPTLTVGEIKLAFEMLLMGDLDNYLPTDQNGNPNRNHYQQFTVEYYTKVLNAYKAKRAAVVAGVARMLPKHEHVVTEDEKQYLRKLFNNEMCAAFQYYKTNKRLPFILMPFLYVERFVEYGLLDEHETEKPADVTEVVANILRNVDASKQAHVKAAQEFNKTGGNETVEHLAKQQRNMQIVEMVFTRLIDDNQTLEAYL